MRGDFSNWRFDPRRNDQGLLHQQGRVTLDADLTDAELIDLAWRTQAGRDVVGANVAAVPATEPDGFAIAAARVEGSDVLLQVRPGRAWIDGTLLYLPGDPPPALPTAPVRRTASYLAPPANLATTTTATIGANVRDAVVLELVLEELNGFQDPGRLIEPALGGPDTAERITPRTRFGLVRLGPGEDCTSIAGRIADGPAGKGRLTVSLDLPEVVAGECPTVAGGGYSGFEHNLYRVEIAQVNAGPPRFKWSRWNGGLVGRGVFQAGAPKTVTITANRTAVVTSGLTAFYLEALVWDGERGHWRVAYGAEATLNSDFDLELVDPPVFGSFTLGADPVFFRLWDRIENVAAFTNVADPVELRDGIRLVFDAPAGVTYRGGDYWTFSVRAGEIANDDVLIDAQPPAGPLYRRVPLAEINWTAAQHTAASGAIEDCRKRFHPLVSQKRCCTLLVGDGVRTFGDFNSLEEAALHLPPSGGALCLLPGIHFTNLVLQDRVNVRIHGCPRRTLVLPRPNAPTQPIVRLRDCMGLSISDLDLVSVFGPAIVAEGTTIDRLKELDVHDCRMLARTYAVRVDRGQDVTIARNRVWLLDTPSGRAAIQLRATRALVERNALGVWPFEEVPPSGGGGDGGGRTPNPSDPCADPDDIYASVDYVVAFAQHIWATAVLLFPKQPYRAWGGIHLLGGCEQVRVLENQVDGGAGNGVTLGGLLPGEVGTNVGNGEAPRVPSVRLTQAFMLAYVLDESREPAADVDVFLHRGSALAGQGRSDDEGQVTIKVAEGPYTVAVEPGHEIVSVSETVTDTAAARTQLFVIVVRRAPTRVPEEEAFLYQITVQENEIERMALSGIGFRRFDDTAAELPPIDLADPTAMATALATVFAPRELMGTCNVVRDLVVRGNRIHHNLRAVFDPAMQRAARTVGQGGISLALVETALVADNHVYDNGLSAVNPTCGIFVGYGEDVEIRGNLIAGNGPLVDAYEEQKLEGLRGGVFVRFASAFLIGGEADAQQKSALRILDNRIDQPAGRAITAFAFGPVACEGNYLNSERAGRWSMLDLLVGGVLILDLGGIQRQTRVASTNTNSFLNTRGDTVDTAAVGRSAIRVTPGTARAAELLLPGGEVLYNGNQLRLGPDHRSVMGALVVTLDDLGFDGNQTTLLRPDLLFTNTLCLAFSLRVTDNRFRERARQCLFSLVSMAQGMTTAAQLVTMNTTAHNQGDHCIVALSNAPAGGLPVIADGNLEANRTMCRELLRDPTRARAMVVQALIVSLFTQAQNLDVGSIAGGQKAVTTEAARSVQGASAEYRYAQSRETVRLEQQYGAASQRVQLSKARLAQSGAALQQLDVETELSAIREAAVPEGGSVVDGRVTDAGARGRQDVTVQLVRADGSSLDVVTKADASGYYALPLNAEQAKRVAAEQDVFVAVTDAQGTVLQRSARITLEANVASRTDLVVPAPKVSRAALAGGTVLFDNTVSTTSTPLESVRGIGPKTAAKLRAAGIADVETLLRTPGAKLVDVAGFDADVVRRNAERVVRDATNEAARKRSPEA